MTLPVALPIGSALALIVAVGVGGFAAGMWLGGDLASGRAARNERDRLLEEIDSLGAAARELRQRGLNVAQDFRTAQIRFETTAEGLADDLASLDAAFAAHRTDVESLLASHPDWGDCRIGPDGMRAWNAAAAGARHPADATAGTARGTEAALPGGAAAAARGRPAGVDAQLRGGGTSVPPLSLPDGPIDGGTDPL